MLLDIEKDAVFHKYIMINLATYLEIYFVTLGHVQLYASNEDTASSFFALLSHNIKVI